MNIAHSCRVLRVKSRLIAAVAATALGGVGAAQAAPTYQQTNLVTDSQEFLASQGFTPAAFEDPNLINPWGVSRGPTTPFWVSNQGTGTSTLYNGEGEPFPIGSPLVVDIPQAGPPAGPTGQVFNSFAGAGAFQLSSGGKSGPGFFFFANLDGSISGWNPSGDPTQAVMVVPSSTAERPAIYTGLAIGSSGGGSFLYAPNRISGGIDVFDSNFAPVTLAGNFVDPGPNPDGLVPFNVHAIGGQIYVTYSIAGDEADEAELGSGFVSIFNPDGTFVRRIESDQFSSPWGVALAPDDFGDFSNALLIANFSEEFGFINAFDASTGVFLGALQDLSGEAINIPYLWEILFGNGGNGGDPDDLYFAAGIGDELHGLFGELAPVEEVPEPASLGLLGAGLLGLVAARRQREQRG